LSAPDNVIPASHLHAACWQAGKRRWPPAPCCSTAPDTGATPDESPR